MKRRNEEARAEISTQWEQLAAEVARQTEATVTKELAERLVVEKKAIAEAEASRAAQRFAGELAGRDRDRKEQGEYIERTSSLRLEVNQKAARGCLAGTL